MALTPRLAIMIDASGTRAVGEFKKVESASKSLEAQTKKTNEAMAKAFNAPTAKNQGAAAAHQQTEQIKFSELAIARTQLLGKAALVTGGAMLAGFGLATKATMSFDKAMSGVFAVSDASTEKLGQLREAALSSGKAFGFTAVETAAAEEELAKAGVTVDETLGGGLQGTLALAAAGQIEVAEAATIAVQAMNAFSLSGSQVGHIADVFAAGANKSATDVHNLGASLQQSALQAARMGLSLEESVGTLSLFAQNALVGSDAGTSFRTFLQRLTPQSKLAAETMKTLGLEFYDSNGQFIGLSQSAELLQNKIGTLTPEMQSMAIQTIFGADAARAASLAIKAGGEGFSEWAAKVDDSGAAADTAAKRLDNLSGDISKLKSALMEGLIKSSGPATVGLRAITQSAGGAVNAFTGLPSVVQRFGSLALGLGGTLLTVGGAFLILKPKIAAARAELEKLPVVGARANQALGLLGKTAGVVSFVTVLKGLQDLYVNAIAPAAPIDKLGLSLRKLADTDEFGGELKKMGGDLDGLVGKLNKGAETVQGLTNRDFWTFGGDTRDRKKGQQAIDDMDKALADLHNSGHAKEAEELLGKIGTRFTEMGKDFGPVVAKFDDYAAALDATALDAKNADPAVDGLGRSIVVTGSSADSADGQIDGMGDAVEGLGEGTMTAAEQVDKLQTAIINSVNAQHSYDNALIGVADASKQAKDAQHDLDVLLAKGPKDLEKITAATQAHDKALREVDDATKDLTIANEALTKSQTPSTFLEIQSAQDKITTSLLDQVDAQNALTLAIENRDKIRSGIKPGEERATSDELAIGQQDVTDATVEYNKVLRNRRSTTGDVARAHKAMTDAQQDYIDLQKQGIPTAQDLADADEEVARAGIAVHDSAVDAKSAEDSLRTTLDKGTEKDPAVVSARDGVADASQRLKDRTDEATAADVALKKATVDDPEWGTKVADARDKVAKATRGIKDAQWEAASAAIALKDKTDEMNTAFSTWGLNIDGVSEKLTNLQKEHPEIAGQLNPIFAAIGGLLDAARIEIKPGGITFGTNKSRATPGVHAAAGGIFPARAGGWDVNLAEGGKAEAVIPLSRLASMVDGSKSGGGITIIVNGALDPVSVAQQIDQIMSRYNRGGRAAFLTN